MPMAQHVTIPSSPLTHDAILSSWAFGLWWRDRRWSSTDGSVSTDSRDREGSGVVVAGVEPELNVVYWFPAAGHPLGTSDVSWFEVIGSVVYPADGNPEGRSNRGWYQERGMFVYPIATHPLGLSAEPWFRIVEHEVFTARGHPDDGAAQAWFNRLVAE